MSVSVHRQLDHKTLLVYFRNCALEDYWKDRNSGSLPVGGVETSLSYYFSVGRCRGISDKFSTHLHGGKKQRLWLVAWAGFVGKPLGTQLT